MTAQLNKARRLLLLGGLLVTLAMPTFVAGADPIDCADATTAEEFLNCVDGDGEGTDNNGNGSGGSGGPV